MRKGKESKGKAEWILAVEKQRVNEMLRSFGGKTPTRCRLRISHSALFIYLFIFLNYF